jgi:hypothetical protein
MQLHTLALIGTVGLLAGSSFAGVASTVAFNSLAYQGAGNIAQLCAALDTARLVNGDT